MVVRYRHRYAIRLLSPATRPQGQALVITQQCGGRAEVMARTIQLVPRRRRVIARTNLCQRRTAGGVTVRAASPWRLGRARYRSDQHRLDAASAAFSVSPPPIPINFQTPCLPLAPRVLLVTAAGLSPPSGGAEFKTSRVNSYSNRQGSFPVLFCKGREPLTIAVTGQRAGRRQRRVLARTNTCPSWVSGAWRGLVHPRPRGSGFQQASSNHVAESHGNDLGSFPAIGVIFRTRQGSGFVGL